MVNVTSETSNAYWNFDHAVALSGLPIELQIEQTPGAGDWQSPVGVISQPSPSSLYLAYAGSVNVAGVRWRLVGATGFDPPLPAYPQNGSVIHV